MNFLTRNYVVYGLILAGITITCLLLMEVSGNNETFDMKSSLQMFYMIIAPFIVWCLGIRAKRKQLKNTLTYRQGFVEGVKISLVYAIVSPFIFLFYYLIINPPIVEYVRTAYGLTGSSDAVVISVDMIAQFVTALIFGSIYSACIALFFKTKKRK
jgi:hypothetical protein